MKKQKQRRKVDFQKKNRNNPQTNRNNPQQARKKEGLSDKLCSFFISALNLLINIWFPLLLVPFTALISGVISPAVFTISIIVWGILLAVMFIGNNASLNPMTYKEKLKNFFNFDNMIGALFCISILGVIIYSVAAAATHITSLIVTFWVCLAILIISIVLLLIRHWHDYDNK